MGIEDKLELMEVMFHRAAKDKYHRQLDSMYNYYVNYHNEMQEYIWYHNLETGINYVNEVYNGIRK